MRREREEFEKERERLLFIGQVGDSPLESVDE